MELQKDIKPTPALEAMFKAGAHFGYSKSRRHPTVSQYIFGAKNKVEIIDLEKTQALLDAAKEFVKKIASERGQVIFVGGKKEAEESVRAAAQSVEMPYVAGRWIGGTFTNFGEVKKRVARLEDLTSKREKGELGKYTKKERLLIDREIAKLERFFSGILPMKAMPKAMFVIDSKKEIIAVTEAKKVGIPVIALTGSDCNLKEVDYPIVANDSSVASIRYFVNEIAAAYNEGLMTAAKEAPKPAAK